MPFRPRKETTSKFITLSETLNWIAFDNFEGPSQTPAEIAVAIFGSIDDPDEISIVEWNREHKLDMAVDELFAALRDGDVNSRGFSIAAEDKDDIQKAASETRSKNEPISQEFWQVDGVCWDEGSATSRGKKYIDIVLSREEVLKVWRRLDEEEVSGPDDQTSCTPTQKSRRGRPAQHSQLDFLALCVCEAATNGLPSTQAEFARFGYLGRAKDA
jgi:hypothetical protein